MKLRVRDVDASVEFLHDTLGLREVERVDGCAYLSCNQRHHELILAHGERIGYEHVGLEVPDAAALDETLGNVERAGGKRLESIDREPGIAGAALVEGPGGHRFKLFHGMATDQDPSPAPGAAGVRAERCEHVSLDVHRLAPMAKFLREGLGFQFSDQIGNNGMWFRCEEIHHGVALVRTPSIGLAHYAFALPSFDDFKRIGDYIHGLGRRFEYGPGRHGPGNNLFIYFFDPAGVMVECCSEMALVGPGHPYQPRKWKLRPRNVSLWGGLPTRRFLTANAPVITG
ncbi:MAG TPA: VOC family protein [Solirubrobacteraceae bacterium]|nr:VOC family protein [Solirubrobacteraceae bacterium]